MPTKSEGQLDPGAPPRRKSISGCKCLLFSAATVFLAGVGVSFLFFITTFTRTFFTPHKGLYQNTTLESVNNRATVVQPLIDREQSFDLAATVWLRTSKGGRHCDEDDADRKDVKEGEGDDGAVVERTQEEVVVEEPLLSTLIFHGVRLTDKNLRTVVNFTVPTAIFRDVNLTNYDLRASIMLIPNSPSLLDHVARYSSYIPDTVDVLPVRTWPFPLGSQDLREKSLADKALESFGVSIPLLEFHGVQSRCTAADGNSTAASVDANENSYDEEEEDELEEETLAPDPVPSKAAKATAPRSSLEKTGGKPVLRSHPYIVTRTQIRVLDEVNLLNRQAYQKAHKKLMETSCGQGVLRRPSRYWCKRPYRFNGNWETQLQLRVANQSTGKVRTEWAYAPFISVSQHAHGQKDLLPIPVDREDCSKSGKVLRSPSFDSPERNAIDVSWRISYSGRTPAKMNLGDITEKSKWYSFNETEISQAIAHDRAEMANGLVGHRFSEDAHPRRRFLLYLLSSAISFLATCLDIRYWFTRRSTAGISIPGTAIVAVSSIVKELDSIRVRGITRKFSFPGWIAALLFSVATTLVLPLMQLKAILRVDISWWKGWIPVVSLANATHSERASERMEARTSWRTKLGLFLLVVASYSFLEPHKYAIIAAMTPDLPKTDETVERLFSDHAEHSTRLIGSLLQIILNWRSHSFAGGYKVSVALMLALTAISLAAFVPAIVGNFATRPALTAHGMVGVVLILIFGWQASVLPSVPQVIEEDHIE
ncbi:hypothetical protein LshimejAT787_1202590 [Lyophyllum shimeji]|uniref:Uncharacterized protein n=1 Tax=Lyophyllum shimeji TaxID=47721 RepID=A0A9P3PTX6_LYOSH|nr:hypothetical protein LshimejAT787_1202590 [Lyophyllum shimeji]